MKRHTKVPRIEQEQLAALNAPQTSTREFATAEELLRHDAGRTEVPPVIAERLLKSIQNLPHPAPTWWQRWLKR